MEFQGNNLLTAILKEKILNYEPGFGPSLNNLEEVAAQQRLSRYIGTFTYVNAKSGVDYATFLVNSNGERYLFRIYDDELPQGWSENVETI
jgi:hypothetical protein